MYPPVIVLVGLKHVGKSSVARVLEATIPHATSVDIDDEMISRAQRSRWFNPVRGEVVPIPMIRQLYRFLGRQAFLSWEADVVRSVLMEQTDATRIVATGGGIADNPRAVDQLARSGVTLYLWNDPLVLYQRVVAHGIPPFLDPERPEASFREIAERRDKKYREIADHVVDISKKSQVQAAQSVLDTLR